MANETKPGVRFTFEDGHSVVWTSGPEVNLSGEVIAAFGRVCILPHPVEFEIIEVPVNEI